MTNPHLLHFAAACALGCATIGCNDPSNQVPSSGNTVVSDPASTDSVDPSDTALTFVSLKVPNMV